MRACVLGCVRACVRVRLERVVCLLRGPNLRMRMKMLAADNKEEEEADAADDDKKGEEEDDVAAGRSTSNWFRPTRGRRSPSMQPRQPSPSPRRNGPAQESPGRPAPPANPGHHSPRTALTGPR